MTETSGNFDNKEAFNVKVALSRSPSQSAIFLHTFLEVDKEESSDKLWQMCGHNQPLKISVKEIEFTLIVG